jgi:PAS domain S-box-containing protein
MPPSLRVPNGDDHPAGLGDMLPGESLRLLNSAVLQSKEAILITDAQLDLPGPRVVFVNPAFTKMTGYSFDEIVGKTPRLLQGPKTDRAVLSRLRRNLEQGEVFEGEAVNYRRDGTEFVLEWQIAPILNAGGKITHFVAIQRDITARKQSEIAANRLAAIIASSQDAIIGKDLDSIVNSWNRGAEKIFGYTAAEMIGTSITRLMPADRQDEENQILDRIKRGQNVEHFETLRLTKDGRLINVSVTASPIRDSAGRIVGVSKSARDITKRKQEEEATRASEARYRTLFDHAPDGIVIADPQSYYLDANATMCRMLGRTRDELIGLHASDIVVPGEVAQIEPAISAIKTTLEYRREWRFRRKDGSIFDADVIATVMPDGNLLGVIRDVTERKRAAEELRSTHARLQHLLEHSPAVIYALRIEGQEIVPYLASENVTRLLGFSTQETLSHEWWAGQLYPEDRERAMASMSETLAKGVSRTEYRLFRKNGTVVWVEDNRQLIRNATGEPAEFVGVWTDITERKLAELRLKLQYAVTAVLAEGAPLEQTNLKVIAMIGKGLGWNLGELWEVDKMANVLRLDDVWHPMSTEFREFVAASRLMTFGRGKGLPGRVWASGHAERTPDIALDPGFIRRTLGGEPALHGWVGFPIKLREEILGVVGFFSLEVQEPDDELLATLTNLGIQVGQFIDKRNLAEQFRQAQKMEAIGTLAGGVAHDFNNILSVMMGYTELTKMTATDNPELLGYMNEMEKAGVRATNLVRQILTFSRREESKREVLKLGPVVEEALRFLRSTIPSAIEFKVELDENVSPVLADATQIHQIVMNLGTNAWQAMRDRPGRLEVKLEAFEVDADLAESQLHVRPGPFVRLSVTDTGCGMDRATMNRIFEPFFTTKGPGEGTGLGLSVVHGIMQGHDGAIAVYSQPGGGTTFHLYFPAFGGDVVETETKGRPGPAREWRARSVCRRRGAARAAGPKYTRAIRL